MFHVVQLNPPEPDGVVVAVTATGGRHLRTRAKAIVRSGHQILLAAYRVLVPAQPYTDPGPTTLSRLTAQRLTHQVGRRLQDPAYQVHIATCTDAA